jgi:archaeosortase C (PEF-CTERM variant)
LFYRTSMDFSELQAVLRRHRNFVVFAALVFLVAGLDLLLNPPVEGGVELLSLPFLAGAVFLFAIVFWPGKVGVPAEAPPSNTLAHRFMKRVTFGWRLVPFFPFAGIVIIALDVIYNLLFPNVPLLQIHDTVTIMFAVSLIAYPFVPQRFDRERDFVLFFFLILVLMLVVPLLLFRLVQGNYDEGVNAYSSTLLAPQLQWILNLLGVKAGIIGSLPGSSAPTLEFITQSGAAISVQITTSCSGIYSFSIFAAAFAAFILTEFDRTNWRVWSLLVMGFVASYVANILRMTVIVLAGYFANTSAEAEQSMMIAHSNAGWLIFLGWITLFWLLMYRFLFPRKKRTEAVEKREFSSCPLCGEPLSPTVPGFKCDCGKMYHVSCIQKKGRCPACDRAIVMTEFAGKTLT